MLHRKSDSRLDVYLAGHDSLARRGLVGRRIVRPPEYVILHKLRFRQQGASDRHLRDIRGMLRVLGDAMDRQAATG